MKFYVYNKSTLKPLKIYLCDPEQHGVDNGDAAAGCEHASAAMLGSVDVAGSFIQPGAIDFSGVDEESVPPLSKAPQLPPTQQQIDAYKAAVLADAERVIAASTQGAK